MSLPIWLDGPARDHKGLFLKIGSKPPLLAVGGKLVGGAYDEEKEGDEEGGKEGVVGVGTVASVHSVASHMVRQGGIIVPAADRGAVASP